MKQFLLPEDCPEELDLTGADFHYLRTVRRLGEGDAFAGIDPAGNMFHVAVLQVAEGKMRVQLIPAGKPKPDMPAVHLYQCLPKGGKFDQVIRMATEAGVSKITPVISQYTQVKLSQQDEKKKADRWQRVVQEAVQQSGSPHVPKICAVRNLGELVNEAGEMLFFHQAPIATKTLHDYCSRITGEIGIVIGPEGGFSSEEVEKMTRAGWKAAYLGPWVLRTEHAGLYAIAAVQTMLLERDSWKIQ